MDVKEGRVYCRAYVVQLVVQDRESVCLLNGGCEGFVLFFCEPPDILLVWFVGTTEISCLVYCV